MRVRQEWNKLITVDTRSGGHCEPLGTLGRSLLILGLTELINPLDGVASSVTYTTTRLAGNLRHQEKALLVLGSCSPCEITVSNLRRPPQLVLKSGYWTGMLSLTLSFMRSLNPRKVHL